MTSPRSLCCYATVGILWRITVAAPNAAAAFIGPSDLSSSHRLVQVPTTMTTTTSLSAVLPPPLIIGPMIKKMRAEQEKKKMPLADTDERIREAPGVRIGARTWKWPPVWPYDDAMFKSVGEAQAVQQQQTMSNLASMLSGVPQLPSEEDIEKRQQAQFNAVKYWGEEQASVPHSILDAEQVEKLQAHFAFYLRDGMSILELGAAENSYLPKDLKPSRHVGVGANLGLMEQNPSLTNRLLVDLNQVVPDRDVDNDDFRRLAQEPFDAIITTNTVDYLTSPREVFRSAWYLLKPGGLMIVAFTGREWAQEKFVDAQTRIWKQYNDDQHMWITGSFFQFSAGDGWESLLGFDISPASALALNASPVDRVLKAGAKPNNLFVVQARKGYQDESINLENLEASIKSLCWMLPVIEERDKRLVVPRLTRAIETATDERIRAAIERNIQHLPTIYETLMKMDQFAFTFSMQSQLAADLLCDPDFTASDVQIQALKEGLGLRTPREDFWKPVGQLTAAMEIEDKISLLGFVVPRFGTSGSAEVLQAFMTGLQPTYTVLRRKCPTWSNSDVQLLGTELLAADVLHPDSTARGDDSSRRQDYAMWLESFTATELEELLQLRKSFRRQAAEDMTTYKENRENERKRIEELRQKMAQQVEQARMERSMIFNPKTEKMELFDNPMKKQKEKKSFLPWNN